MKNEIESMRSRWSSPMISQEEIVSNCSAIKKLIASVLSLAGDAAHQLEEQMVPMKGFVAQGVHTRTPQASYGIVVVKTPSSTRALSSGMCETSVGVG